MEVWDIFKKYMDLVELMSIDEVYLDVIENKMGIKFVVKFVKMI